MLVTKKEFSDLAGVTAPTIHRGVKMGWLTGTPDGRMKLDCEVNAAYLERKKLGLTKAKAKIGDMRPDVDTRQKKKIKPVEKPRPKAEVEEKPKVVSTQHYMMTPKAQKEVEKLEIDIQLKQLDLKSKRGELIDRTRTITFLFLHLDILQKNILNMPVHTVDRIIALAQSKKPTAKREIIDYLTRFLSKTLKDTRDLVIKTDKELMGKFDDEDDTKS